MEGPGLRRLGGAVVDAGPSGEGVPETIISVMVITLILIQALITKTIMIMVMIMIMLITLMLLLLCAVVDAGPSGEEVPRATINATT